MKDQGVVRLVFKKLVKNNNDKQQIYIATDMAKVGFLPTGDVDAARSESSKLHPNGNAIFRSSMPLTWLSADGRRCSAENTKLIYYPQYPEVRISGFLEGCAMSPSDLLSRGRRGQEPGRILFLGVTEKGSVIGHAVAPENAIATEIGGEEYPAAHGVLKEVFLDARIDSRKLLIKELSRIHDAGWLESVKLTRDGMQPYDKRNGIGYTLEAHLGVMPNGDAKPDFRGWEVKGSTVSSFQSKLSVNISILTCSPTGGLIRDIGWRKFVECFGYRNPEKPKGRIDFNGAHKYGIQNAKTGMTLGIQGYKNKKIEDEDGGVIVTDSQGRILMKLHFAKFLEHWKTKHSNAAFVPGVCRLEPSRQYWFGREVKLATGTDFFRVLEAIKSGSVIYDPGCWVNPMGERAKDRGHERHQIRVVPRQLASLYRKVEDLDVTACT